VLLAKALFGNNLSPLNLLIRPLPAWASYGALVLFPVTQGLVELPAYFLYALPRIEAQTRKAWLAITFSALGLAVQHVGAPLLFDARFITWRLLMFIPFAFLVAIVLRWRPRLLPYLAVVHVLLDMATAALWLSLL
jgi:hypothetical protein